MTVDPAARTVASTKPIPAASAADATKRRTDITAIDWILFPGLVAVPLAALYLLAPRTRSREEADPHLYSRHGQSDEPVRFAKPGRSHG